jgi:hypothetical protein
MRLVSSWVRVLWPHIRKMQRRPSSSIAKPESRPHFPTCLHASCHREVRPGVRERGSCSRSAGGGTETLNSWVILDALGPSASLRQRPRCHQKVTVTSTHGSPRPVWPAHGVSHSFQIPAFPSRHFPRMPSIGTSLTHLKPLLLVQATSIQRI